VEHSRCLETVQQDAHASECFTCYMWTMGNDKRHWNCSNKFTATRYIVEFCYFCGSTECNCRLSCISRGQVCHMSRLLGWGGIQMSFWGSINLVDMYAQYGSIQAVLRLSYKMPSQDVVCLGMWNVGKGKRNWNCLKKFV
jgi:hypothetical protein